MKRLLIPFVLIPVLPLCVWAWTRYRTSPPASAAPVIFARPPYDPTRLTKTITFYEERVRTQSLVVFESNMLSGLYSQRCRETGDISDALRAEKIARQSLQSRTRNNAAAWDQLAIALLTQHRFNEALEAAQSALKSNPGDTGALDLRIEIWTERGDYKEAETALRERSVSGEDIHLKALHARLDEMNGLPQRALELMRQAQEAADRNYDLPNENVAWFHMRVGDLLAAAGRANEAERSYQESLNLFPRDYKTLTSLTRLECGRGNWQQAAQWGQKAADIVPTPEVVALLGDAYTALKKKKEAEDQFRLIDAMGTLSKAQGTVFDRQRALYLADHDRHLDEALTLARRELTTRHDVYAYDTLAWVCCKTGLLDEAYKAMQQALSHNTQDARLFYHAGIIAERRGDHAQAKTYLSQALALNPYFLPFAPEQARKLVARL